MLADMKLLKQASQAGQVRARGEPLRPFRHALFLQAGLAAQIQAKGGEVPRKVITAPFVQIPLGVTEDRLVGTVDIEASMKVTHHWVSPRPCTCSGQQHQRNAELGPSCRQAD